MEAKTGNLTDMDKFKRRMIRTVARLLIKEKMSEEDVFIQMQKETKCNCQLLWNRMRLLTIKKLQRLLNADDKSDNIANVGRMSITDWLLFDMVMVHEDIDVIGKEKMLETRKDPKPLLDLFVLVQRFNIEVPTTDSLADKWTAATIHYNSMGHQCSPMLMQRRWYQLKQFTRDLFYDYWFAYRGVDKHLPNALKYEPTKLQRAVAKRFPRLIVQPFLKWEEMIERDLVIMPDVFEHKIRQKNLPEPKDENSADVVIVEAEVETINLEDDSDSEQQEEGPINGEKTDEGPEETQSVDNVKKMKIKTEKLDEDPQEYCLTAEENILEREREVIASIDNAEFAFDHENMSNAVSAAHSNNKAIASDAINESNIEALPEDNIKSEDTEWCEENVINSQNNEDVVTLPQITNVIGNVDMSSIANISSDPEIKTSVRQDIKSEVIDIEDDIIMVPTVGINEKEDISISNALNMDNITEYLKNAYESVVAKKYKPILNIQCKKAIQRSIQELKTVVESNIEVNDLEIEIAKKAEEFISKKSKQDSQDRNLIDIEMEIAKKADLFIKSRSEKIVEDDIIMTDLEFADDGVEFIDDGIEIEDHDKASSTGNADFPLHSVKENTSSDNGEDDMENADTGKFDLKLLMDPVVYTLRLDDMQILKNKCIQSVKSDQLINEIDVASKIISPKSSVINIKQEENIDEDKEIYDDIFSHNFDEDFEEPQITDDKKVKLTSYLLSKPKVRDYNFIQLCKNPDFNTRLKRLNVGFFGSLRNRELLKACKPMTVDVSKAFEQKMINGTLYLKDTLTQQQDSPKCGDNFVFNVLTSTAHSLLDGLVANMANTEPHHKEPNLAVERNTVINLPNINEVRRINQKLLTAEVTPIQISSDCNKETAVSNDNLFNLDAELAKKSAEIAKKVTENGQKPTEAVNKPKSTDTAQKPSELNKGTRDLTTQQESTNIEETPVNKTNGNLRSSHQNNSGKQTSELSNQATAVSTTSVKPKKPKVKQNRGPVVSWLKQPVYTWPMKDDILLTIDSLRKMIYVMEGQSSDIMADVALPVTETVTPISIKEPTLETKTSMETENSHKPEKKSTVDNKKKVKKSIEKNSTAAKPAAKMKRGRRRKIGTNTITDVNTVVDSLPVTNSTETTDTEVVEIQNPNDQPIIPTLKINVVYGNDDNIHKTPIIKIDNNVSFPAMDDNSSHSTHSISDVILNEGDIAANEICVTSSEDISNNDTTQSSISAPVNHLFFKMPSVPANQKTMCDASTITADPKVQSLSVYNNNIDAGPIFTVLPMPKAGKSKKKSWTAKIQTVPKTQSSIQMPSVNSTQNHIILDASKTRAILPSSHQPLNVNDNIIPSSVFNRIVSESTLKLSKDKILLSSITFPKLTIPQEITSPLPPGVQLALPPNGELSYILDSGVVLDDGQLAKVQAVIETVKLQFQVKAPPISAQPIWISNEVVDLTDEDGPRPKTQSVVENVDNQILQNDIAAKDTSTNDSSDPAVNVSSECTDQNTESVSIANETCYNNSPNIVATDDSCIEGSKASEITVSGPTEATDAMAVLDDSMPISKEIIDISNSNNLDSAASKSENIQIEIPSDTMNESSETLSSVPAKNVPISNRKSILSDLMEISGIGEEDVAPVVEEQRPLIQREQPNSIVIQLESGSKLSVAPITSFRELKYAYEKNAVFYELHCITGIIQKVNVCLSKASKAVVNDGRVQSALEANMNLPRLVPIKNSVPKVFPNSTLIKKKQSKIIRNHSQPLILRKLKPLQPLNAKNSLLKPNLSNVRKCLLRSKMKLYEKHQKPITLDITSDDSDSSDDEPLIKKANRMRESREKAMANNQGGDEIKDSEGKGAGEVESLVDVLFTGLSPSDVDSAIIPETDAPIAEADATITEEDATIAEAVAPIAEDDEIMEEYLDENLIAEDTIMEEEGESGEECILGV